MSKIKWDTIIPLGMILLGLWLKFGADGGGILPGPPAPIPEPGLRVMVIYNPADLGKMPAQQVTLLTSGDVAAWLNANCVKASDGKTAMWAIIKDGADLTNADPIWQKVMQRKRDSLPWIVISNGKTGYEGPLPANVTDTLALLKKYGGSNAQQEEARSSHVGHVRVSYHQEPWQSLRRQHHSGRDLAPRRRGYGICVHAHAGQDSGAGRRRSSQVWAERAPTRSQRGREWRALFADSQGRQDRHRWSRQVV